MGDEFQVPCFVFCGFDFVLQESNLKDKCMLTRDYTKKEVCMVSAACSISCLCCRCISSNNKMSVFSLAFSVIFCKTEFQFSYMFSLETCSKKKASLSLNVHAKKHQLSSFCPERVPSNFFFLWVRNAINLFRICQSYPKEPEEEERRDLKDLPQIVVRSAH
jgi:hypothetical protein